jgi:S-(hydroxymethyl)glutathione dehydrogenase / alcohol dehydrogenase
MKAAVFRKINDPLVIEDVEVDAPGPNEVRIRTAACGVCHSDLHIVQGILPWPPGAVMGHEAAGSVTAVGSAVTYVKPGDRVVACPSPFCGKCAKCLTGHPHLCAGRGTLRRRRNERPRLASAGAGLTQFADIGGYAEELLLHENAVVKIADAMPLDRAALIGCGVTTGMGAVLNTAKVQTGASVAIFGAGGVGLAAIQAARLAGAAKIIAVDLLENKLAAARKMGATHTVDASASNPVDEIRRLTGGGADYAFEVIGIAKVVEQAMACVGPGGTAVSVGVVPPTDPIKVQWNDLFQEKKLTGSQMGSNRFRIDIPAYVDFYLQGRLNLDDMVTRRVKLDEINEAFRAMTAGEVLRSVVVFE